MNKEEKYYSGMFKNVDKKVMDFIVKHSGIVCPNGKYDNAIHCSQADIIRLVNPILNENKHLQNYADHTEFCSWKNNGNGICDCGYVKTIDK